MVGKKGLVCGVGVNDADYPVYKNSNGVRFDCPYYLRWRHMLMRCYSKAWLEKHNTYAKCTVCKEWITFSNFRRWMETQDWQGKQLDKDILSGDLKIYSPETCVFISQNLNKFMNKRENSRGKYPIGVSYNKAVGKIAAACNDGQGKSIHLGYYDDEVEAHLAWKRYKRDLAKKLAEEQEDDRIASKLLGMYL